jgi:hypothetical protein
VEITDVIRDWHEISVLRGEAAPEHAKDVALALLAGFGVRHGVRVARRDLSPEGIRRRIQALGISFG